VFPQSLSDRPLSPANSLPTGFLPPERQDGVALDRTVAAVTCPSLRPSSGDTARRQVVGLGLGPNVVPSRPPCVPGTGVCSPGPIPLRVLRARFGESPQLQQIVRANSMSTATAAKGAARGCRSRRAVYASAWSVAFGMSCGLLLIVPIAVAVATPGQPPILSLTTTVHPPLRFGAVMVYDPQIGAIVLFGGSSASTNCTHFYSDTWTYSANGWSRIRTTTSPPGRESASATYDPSLGGVLLFGGEECGVLFANDTWLFKSGNWINLTANLSGHVSAPGEYGAALAFDARDGYDVLYGGWHQNGMTQTTWTFTNNTWSMLKCVPRHCISPYTRTWAAMSYDPIARQVVLFGGEGCHFYAQCYSALNDTWRYSRGVWANVTAYAGTSPGPRLESGLSWDAKDKQLVAFGGYTQTVLYGVPSNDTWVYVNHTWSNVTGGRSPPPTGSMSFAYDPKLQMVIMFGGTTNAPPPAYWKFQPYTWGYASGNWTRL
jgi:hypothetical protein